MLHNLRPIQKFDHDIDAGSRSEPEVQNRVVLAQIDAVALRLAPRQ